MLIKERKSTNTSIVNRKAYIMGENEFRNAETYYNKKSRRWLVLFLCDGSVDTHVYGTKGTGTLKYKTEEQAMNKAIEYINKVV